MCCKQILPLIFVYVIVRSFREISQNNSRRFKKLSYSWYNIIFSFQIYFCFCYLKWCFEKILTNWITQFHWEISQNFSENTDFARNFIFVKLCDLSTDVILKNLVTKEHLTVFYPNNCVEYLPPLCKYLPGEICNLKIILKAILQPLCLDPDFPQLSLKSCPLI